jgi:phosphoglycerate dehydrogenase-like enzyme
MSSGASKAPDKGTGQHLRQRVVGIVGLGHMGSAFALNLIADRHRQ